jgi:hypothetical protein
MNLEADFRSLLLTDAAIAGLIDAERINWGEVPQGRPLPRLCLWNVTRDPDRVMEGPSGFVTAFVQCDCWAVNYDEAKALADALSDFVQGIQHLSQGATNFQGIFIEGRRDGHEPTFGAPVVRYHRVAVDVRIQHGEA